MVNYDAAKTRLAMKGLPCKSAMQVTMHHVTSQATSDLLTELQAAAFKVDIELEKKLVTALLSQLEDSSGEIGGLAVKWQVLHDMQPLNLLNLLLSMQPGLDREENPRVPVRPAGEVPVRQGPIKQEGKPQGHCLHCSKNRHSGDPRERRPGDLHCHGDCHKDDRGVF